MSRIAKRLVQVPQGVKFFLKDNKYHFEGPKGTVQMYSLAEMNVVVNDGVCLFEKQDSLTSANEGSFVVNFQNCLKGVESRFSKKINLVGVGYKIIKKDDQLEFHLGYSHPVKMIFNKERQEKIAKEVFFDLKSPIELIVSSCDKMLLGDVCAKIASIRKYDPYKGKGVLIEGKYYARKEGKKK